MLFGPVPQEGATRPSFKNQKPVPQDLPVATCSPHRTKLQRLTGQAPKNTDQAPKITDPTAKITSQSPKIADETPKIIGQAPKIANQTTKITNPTAKITGQYPKIEYETWGIGLSSWYGLPRGGRDYTGELKAHLMISGSTFPHEPTKRIFDLT